MKSWFVVIVLLAFIFGILYVGGYFVNNNIVSNSTASITSSSTATIGVNIETPPKTQILRAGGFHLGDTLVATGVPNANYSNPQAATSAESIFEQTSEIGNTLIVNANKDSVEPSPGVYSWTFLDQRIRFVEHSGAIPTIDLAAAPDWMRPTASKNDRTAAPTPDHYADFAALAKQIALHYPEVKYYDVWSELKGFWNPTLDRWDYEGYTQMYNDVYTALKSVSPDIQVGGPYALMNKYNPSSSSDAAVSHGGPSSIKGPYGSVNQNVLDALQYWLAHKVGADFISIDGSVPGAGDNSPGLDKGATLFAYAQYFGDITKWLRSQTSLPIWWAEWYSIPHHGGLAADQASYTLAKRYQNLGFDEQNAVMTNALMQMAENGARVALRWAPEGRLSLGAFQGDQESVWSDTSAVGGGQPYPFATTMQKFKSCFSSGVTPTAVQLGNTNVSAMSSSVCTVLVNQTAVEQTVSVNGTSLNMSPYMVNFSAMVPK